MTRLKLNQTLIFWFPVNLHRFLQAFLDYIVANNWTNIAVIYEQYTLDIVILQVIYFRLSAIIPS